MKTRFGLLAVLAVFGFCSVAFGASYCVDCDREIYNGKGLCDFCITARGVRAALDKKKSDDNWRKLKEKRDADSARKQQSKPKQSSGSSSGSGYSSYDPYEAQRLADEAEAERQWQEALREAARKKKLRKDAAKARKTWDKNDAETMRQMESMFASSSKKKIPKLKCDCNNGWRDCEWCENGTRDCTRYGCRGGTENCGCVRPGVGPKPDCPDCKGSGLIQCTVCKGKGTMPCNWCNGKGKVRCWACGHDFRYPDQNPPPEPLKEMLFNLEKDAAGPDGDLSKLPVEERRHLRQTQQQILDGLVKQAAQPLLDTPAKNEQPELTASRKSLASRRKELIEKVVKEEGGVSSDPAQRAALTKKVQAALKDDAQMKKLREQIRIDEMGKYRKQSPAFAELDHVVYGNAVDVPSFDAKVKLLPKNNLRDQIKGPLGKPVPPTREMFKKAFLQNEEAMWNLESEFVNQSHVKKAYDEGLDFKARQLEEEYLSEFKKIAGTPGAPANLEEYISRRSETDPEASRLYREYLGWRIQSTLSDIDQTDYCRQIAARQAEHKQLLDLSPGAARIAVGVRRDAMKQRLNQMEAVQAKKRSELQATAQRKLEWRREYKQARAECDQLAEKLHPSMSEADRNDPYSGIFGYQDSRVMNSHAYKRLAALEKEEISHLVKTANLNESLIELEKRKQQLRHHGIIAIPEDF